MAACHNRKQRISDLKTELKTFGEKSEGSRQRMLEKKVRTLESKLVKQTQKEQTHKAHYERLLKEERELLNRLKETSDHTRQEAFDLHKSQLESLVSSLRVFVVKTCDIDRTSPLKTAIDNTAVDDITNATCDLTSQKYVYPDVDAWHQRVGYFQKIPTPFIMGMGRDPKKGLTEMKRLAREVTSAMAQPQSQRLDV